MLVWANQSNFFENATACSKRTLKTRVAKSLFYRHLYVYVVSPTLRRETTWTTLNFYRAEQARVAFYPILNRGSISPTFYEKLLRSQIPKVQKDSQVKQLFALLGSVSVKAAGKHVDEIDPGCPSNDDTPGGQFNQHFTSCFFILKCFAQLLCTYSLGL